MIELVAFIPAKGNSSRVKKKNLKLLAGRSLFLHSIDFAIKQKDIDQVFLSSDSDEILEKIVETDKLKKVLRGKRLTKDHITCLDVIEEFSKEYINIHGELFQYLALLQPTHPFRDENIFNKAFEVFKESSADRLVTGKKEYAILDGVPGIQMVNVLDGNFYLYKAETLEQLKKSLVSENIYFFEMPEDHIEINIDYPSQFEIAQGIANWKYRSLK